MNDQYIRRVLGGKRLIPLCAAFLLAACATTPQVSELDQFKDVAAVQQRVDELVSSGDVQKAQAMLEGAAKANPTDPAPWVRLAQLQFDRGNYSGTIAAAEEAVQRDANNTQAKGLALVASLRIAVRNIQELRGGVALGGDTRGEAERLARTLRETIKEDVLVPVAPSGETKKKSRTASAKQASPVAQTAPAASAAPAAAVSTAPAKPAAPAAKAPAAPAKASADPFGALK
ncbi:tetratricopeptide repeat protein [Niveibacterium sp. 24ML]|uniref:tetratricopeptide repeat protein n=1 Tax=Niveibacterium sp. 24ML TaxID=2985512 RepID=UPI00226E4E4B|nr:tetratricopeptide repeat protein [Niveibacterium sp. 24ML]MCX9154816.1 tetratricopeptide repeat protein [Niveibacterium sp. 24ML]